MPQCRNAYPVTALRDNLLFTRAGTVWALWRLPGVAYLRATLPTKRAIRAMIRRLFTVAGDEMLLAGLASPLPPHLVVARESTGVAATAWPSWWDLAGSRLAQYEHLHQQYGPALQRSHWLAVRLGEDTGWQGLRAVVRAAGRNVAEAFGVTAAPVTDVVAAPYDAAADRLTRAWPPGLQARPATPEETLWFYAHHHTRGTAAAPLLPDPADPGPLAAAGVSLAGLGDLVVLEGGLRDDDLGDLPRRAAYRRYVRVDTEHARSYQALLTLGALPRSWQFPGQEWLTWIDRFDFAVDYAVRIQLRANQRAQDSVRRQARNLVAQGDEYDADLAGVPPELREAVEAVTDEQRQLAATKTDPELLATTVFAVAGDTVAGVDDRARQLAATYQQEQFPVHRPLGEQALLWWGTQPGTTAGRTLHTWRNHMLPPDFASAVPFSATDLGDPTGPILGLNLDAAGAPPVHLDLAAGPPQRSSSMMVHGDLGSGKTYFLMTTAGWIARRGGQVAVIDHTAAAEWVHYADALPDCTSQVVTLTADAAYSFDPLRVFDIDDGERLAQGFLAQLLGISANDTDGLLLAEAIQAQRSGPRGLTVLIDELAARGDDDAARLARRLTTIARWPITRPFFHDGLPPVQLSAADIVVIHTPNLPLPERSKLAHSRHDLTFDELFAPAALYVASAVCRGVAFARTDRFCVIVLDEAWWLESSQAGEQLEEETVRECRRHNAAVLFGSHDPEDVANPTVRGLVQLRLVLRTNDPALGRRAVHSLGRDPDIDTDLVHDITDPTANPGRGLLRDAAGRVGVIHVDPPADPDMRAALETALPSRTPTADPGNAGRVMADPVGADPCAGEPSPGGRETADPVAPGGIAAHLTSGHADDTANGVTATP